MDIVSWDDVRLFLAVAESGSFSAAARQLHIGQPTVSRHIADLEERLGQSLFRRGVGGAMLTPVAERMLPAANGMATQAGELWRLAAGSDAEPQGVVRIASPPGLAWDFLAPLAATMRQRTPRLRLQVRASVTYIDLSRGDADLAMRAKPPAEPELTELLRLETQAGAFASRDYAARLPRSYGLGDVDWISWAPPFDRLPPTPQLEAAIPGFEPAFTSDSYLVQWRAVEEGIGAMVLPRIRHRFSRQSQLVDLDLDLGSGAAGTMHLVCAKSNLNVARVRAVIEILEEEIGAVGATRAR